MGGHWQMRAFLRFRMHGRHELRLGMSSEFLPASWNCEPGASLGLRAKPLSQTSVLGGVGATTGRAGWRKLIARVGRADHSPHIPAAPHTELREHEPARVAANLWPGGLPVIGRRL